jgi:hypothetical protein
MYCFTSAFDASGEGNGIGGLEGGVGCELGGETSVWRYRRVSIVTVPSVVKRALKAKNAPLLEKKVSRP